VQAWLVAQLERIERALAAQPDGSAA
jgi:hypothetical protein